MTDESETKTAMSVHLPPQSTPMDRESIQLDVYDTQSLLSSITKVDEPTLIKRRLEQSCEC